MNYKPVYGREEFFAAYSAFCESTDRIYQEVLLIRKLPVDTHQLWAAVREQGGHEKVQLKKLWASTARRFNHPKSWTNASHYFKTTYEAAGLAHMEDLLDNGQFSIAEFAPGGQLYNPHWRQYQHNNPLQQQQQQLLAVALDPDRSVLDLHLQQQQQQPLLDLGHPTAAVMYAQQQQEQQQQQGRLSSSSGGSSMTGVGSVMGLRLVVNCGTAHGLFDLARQRAICLCAQCSTASGGLGAEMMPTEFERHGGCGSFKKWKKSIMVEETGRNIGSWLTAHGLEILSPSALTKKAKRRQMAAEAAAVAARGQQAGQQQQQQQLMEAGSIGSLSDGVWQQQQQQVAQRSGSLTMHLPTAAAVALAAAMQGRNVQQQQQQQQQQRPFAVVGHDVAQYGDGMAQQQWQQQQQHGTMMRPAAAPLVQQQQQQGMPLHGYPNQQSGQSYAKNRDHIIMQESSWPGPNGQGYSKIHATAADLDQIHPDRPDHRDPRFSDLRSSDPRFCDQISSPAGFTYLDPNRVGSGGFSDSPEGPHAAAAAGACLAAGSGSSVRDVAAAAAALVGRKIKVWWPLDQEWYTATVQTYHPQQRLHSVIYDDGDIEQLNLLEEQWELPPDDRSDLRSPPDLRSDHGSDLRSDQAAMPGANPRGMTDANTLMGHSTAQAAEEGCVQGSPPGHQMAPAAAAAAAAAATHTPAAADSKVTQRSMLQHKPLLHGIRTQDTEAAAMHACKYDLNNAPDGLPVVEMQQQQQQQQQSTGPARVATAERQQQGPGTRQSNVSLRNLSDPDHPDLGRSDPDHETLDEQAAESAWRVSAQQSVEDRPLRVIYDSHAGLIRIILAADLLDAELAMRRQQQQWLRQQQQQRKLSRSGSDQTAAAAGAGRKRQRDDDSLDVERGSRPQESKRGSCSGQQQPAEQQQQQHQQKQQPSRLAHSNQQVDLQRYKEVGNGYEVSHIPELPGFEVLCFFPGYTIDQIRIKAWNHGRLLIKAMPNEISVGNALKTSNATGAGSRDSELSAAAGMPVERVIELPARISAQSAQAMMTDEGQLYVRVRTSG